MLYLKTVAKADDLSVAALCNKPSFPTAGTPICSGLQRSHHRVSLGRSAPGGISAETGGVSSPAYFVIVNPVRP